MLNFSYANHACNVHEVAIMYVETRDKGGGMVTFYFTHMEDIEYRYMAFFLGCKLLHSQKVSLQRHKEIVPYVEKNGFIVEPLLGRSQFREFLCAGLYEPI